MEHIIRISSSTEQEGCRVNLRQYDVMDRDDRVILPDFWERLIPRYGFSDTCMAVPKASDIRARTISTAPKSPTTRIAVKRRGPGFAMVLRESQDPDDSTSPITTSSTLYSHPLSATETELAAPRTRSTLVPGGGKELGKKKKGLGSYSTGSLCRLQRQARNFSLPICGPKASKKRIHTPQGKLRNIRSVTEVTFPTQSVWSPLFWTPSSTSMAAQSSALVPLTVFPSGACSLRDLVTIRVFCPDRQRPPMGQHRIAVVLHSFHETVLLVSEVPDPEEPVRTSAFSLDRQNESLSLFFNSGSSMPQSNCSPSKI